MDKVNSEENRLYLKNAYRVLMTRARRGMAIFIPKGSDEDFDKLFAKNGAGIAAKSRRNMLKKLSELFCLKNAVFVTNSIQNLPILLLYYKR